MKNVLMVLSIIFAVFLYSVDEAYALACPPGQYSEFNKSTGKFQCKKLDGGIKSSGDKSNVQIDSSNHKGVGDNIKNLFVNLAISIGWMSVIVAFFVVIYSGYLYSTAGGKVAQTEEAKRHLIYAFIGMVFGTMTFVIMQLVGGVF